MIINVITAVLTMFAMLDHTVFMIFIFSGSTFTPNEIKSCNISEHDLNILIASFLLVSE